MNNRNKIISRFIATSAAALLAGGITSAQASDVTAIELSHAGNHSQRFTLDASRVVQFSDGRPQLREADTAESRKLKSLKSLSGAPVLKADNGDKVSPVLTDAAGRPHALPGGLLITLKESMAEGPARAKLQAAGLKPVDQINDFVWLVESPTGLGTIELANRVTASGEFAEAVPNWWTPRTKK